MLRSLYSGISGLQNHQKKLDVISNNIANVNTTGYKSSRVVFSNVLSQSMSYATAPTGTKGGVNGMQIGLGVQTSTIDKIHSQGALETTDRMNDVAIQGDGFFVVNDGDRDLYTRAGNFNLDAEGYLVHGGTGFRVKGWTATPTEDGIFEIDNNQPIEQINFLPGEKLAAKASDYMDFRCNLMSSADARSFPSESFLQYGQSPYFETLNVSFEKVDEQTWNFTVKDNEGAFVDLYSAPVGADSYVDSVGTVKLFENGKIRNVLVKTPTGDEISIFSFDTNDDVAKGTPGNGFLDTFSIFASPTEPPKVNYYTWTDNEGLERSVSMKFQKSASDPQVFEWRLYDEENNLIDLDGVRSGQPAFTEDFGTAAFNDVGDITSITMWTEDSANPGTRILKSVKFPSADENDYTINASGNDPLNFIEFNYHSSGKDDSNKVRQDQTMRLSFDNDGRSLLLYNTTSKVKRKIDIGSDRLTFKRKGYDDTLNFDAISGTKHSTSMTTYDSEGQQHELIVSFEKLDTNRWRYSTSLSKNDQIVQDYLSKNPEAKENEELTDAEFEEIQKNLFWDPKNGNTRNGIIVFNNMGKVDKVKTATENNLSSGGATITNPVSFQPIGAKRVTMDLDFTAITQFDSNFSTAARSQNGYEMGMLSTYTINEDGSVTGVYSNGFKQDIAQLSLATFNNNSGLETLDNSMWSPTGNSGVAIVGQPASSRFGTLASGKLEMSNVDLSKEFTDMIIAQRGFQANSKTITTSDQILQDLVNLKR